MLPATKAFIFTRSFLIVASGAAAQGCARDTCDDDGIYVVTPGIALQLKDRTTGQPICDATITIEDMATREVTTVDASTQCSAESPTVTLLDNRSGTFRLSIVSPAHLPASELVRVDRRGRCERVVTSNVTLELDADPSAAPIVDAGAD